MATEEILIAPHAPWQNPFVECVIETITRECLDHLIVWNERSLRRTLNGGSRVAPAPLAGQRCADPACGATASQRRDRRGRSPRRAAAPRRTPRGLTIGLAIARQICLPVGTLVVHHGSTGIQTQRPRTLELRGRNTFIRGRPTLLRSADGISGRDSYRIQAFRLRLRTASPAAQIPVQSKTKLDGSGTVAMIGTPPTSAPANANPEPYAVSLAFETPNSST